MSDNFYKQVYDSMQKISKDWKLTLEITRTFISSQPEDYYKKWDRAGLIISRGFIYGKENSSLVTLPVPEGMSQTLSLVVLERFKEMESSNALPDQRFLYSYIQDVLDLYYLKFNKNLEIDDMLQVLIDKSDDYGQAFRSIGYIGIRARIWEKICRYFSLCSKEYEAIYEPTEDSLKDLVGYLIILLALTQE